MIDTPSLWLHDPPEPGDRLWGPARPLERLPGRVDLAGQLPDRVLDQAGLPLCGANAVAWLLVALGYAAVLPSRLVLHQLGCHRARLDPAGPGCRLRSLLASARRDGWCAEELWPYHRSRWGRPLPREVREAAEANRGRLRFHRLGRDPVAVKTCLALGRPALAGITRFPSFDEAGQTGSIPLPRPGERPTDGHALVLIGYDDRQGCYRVLNSAGRGWGQQGKGELPYAYVHPEEWTASLWTLDPARTTP